MMSHGVSCCHIDVLYMAPNHVIGMEVHALAANTPFYG